MISTSLCCAWRSGGGGGGGGEQPLSRTHRVRKHPFYRLCNEDEASIPSWFIMVKFRSIFSSSELCSVHSFQSKIGYCRKTELFPPAQVNRSKAAVEADLRTLILRLDWEGSLGTRLCVCPFFTAGSSPALFGQTYPCGIRKYRRMFWKLATRPLYNPLKSPDPFGPQMVPHTPNGSMPFHRAQKSLDFQGPTHSHLPS
jgi:hypothetical protein